MAVHLPLSAEAQAEARILMLSSNNILSPASGRPITSPTQDMVLGLFYLTAGRVGAEASVDKDGRRTVTQTDDAGKKTTSRLRSFSSPSEALMAYDMRELSVQEPVLIRLKNAVPPSEFTAPEGWEPGAPFTLETTLGRCLFNEALPADYPFVNYEVSKRQLSAIVNDLAERYRRVDVAHTLDALKEAGFYWATRAGVTIAIEDVVTPPNKAEILERHEKEADRIEKQFQRGVITDDERRQELIEIWTKATAEVAREMEKNFAKMNPVFMMVNSGAR